MDWTAIRVLTENLGQLLDQHESGEYLEDKPFNPMFSRVKKEWWVGIRSLTASLAEALNLKFNVNDQYQEFFSEGAPLEDNAYMQHAPLLVALGRKLLTDLDAATGATCADKSSAASP